MKKRYDSRKRVKAVNFEIGDGVTVRVPRHDRGAGDLRRIPGVIVAKQGGLTRWKQSTGF